MVGEKSFHGELVLFGKNEDRSVFALAVEGDACAFEPSSPGFWNLFATGMGVFGGDDHSRGNGVHEGVLSHAVFAIAPANPNVGAEVDVAGEKGALGLVPRVGGDEDTPTVLVNAEDETSIIGASQLGGAGVEDFEGGLVVEGQNLVGVGDMEGDISFAASGVKFCQTVARRFGWEKGLFDRKPEDR